MELRHLRYFLAVAEAGHITRAAERLGIQQPPLSQQIRALETELGIALLVRQPRGVILTDAGEALRLEAADILARVESLRERMRRMAEGEEGRLAIGFTSSAAAHWLTSEILRACRRRYPQLELALSECNAAEAAEHLAAGRLDAALLRAPVQDAEGLHCEKLLEEEMVLALPLDHPLLGGQGGLAPEQAPPVSLRALATERFILVRRPGAPGMYADLLRLCGALGFSPRIGAEVERMLTNLNLVAAGDGVTVVPACMAGLQRHGIAYRRLLEGARLRAPLTLVWRDASRPQAVAKLLALARELAAGARPG